MLRSILTICAVLLSGLLVMLPAYAQTRPGEYVRETLPGRSVQGVPTAIPVFIGYTERQPGDTEDDISPKLTRSVDDFEMAYGGAAHSKFEIRKSDSVAGDPVHFEIGGVSYHVERIGGRRGFYLYNAIRHYFANGGEQAYIVSVGTYADEAVSKTALADGLHVAGTIDSASPTLLLMPDALMLPADEYYDLANAMLSQADLLEDRIAIIDVFQGDEDAFAVTVSSPDPITEHRDSLGPDGLRNGVSYYPFLRTDLVTADEITRDMIGDEVGAVVLDNIVGPIPSCGTIEDTAGFQAIQGAIARQLNIMPPGPAMAGIYARIDSDRGVWKAPANVDIARVTGLTADVSDANQVGLNVDPLKGKSINLIRSFSDRRAVVWGARTLDSNTADNRYVSQRRTIIFVEQSIRTFLSGQTSLTNEAATWLNIERDVEAFMNELWRAGALAGATPKEAFSVDIGFGVTMTQLDVDEGRMRLRISLALTRPGEFQTLEIVETVEN